MTPLVAESHARSRRFHADIARRAALISSSRKVEIEPAPVPDADLPSPVLSDPAPPPILFSTNKVEQIKRVICRRFGISKEQIESNSRLAKLVLPRQIAMHLARKYTTHSFPEIGRRFGGRDHTTILYAHRKIEHLAATDMSMAVQLKEIKAELFA